MHARGLCTRDIEDALREATGENMVLSRSSVSRITETLWEDFEAISDSAWATRRVEDWLDHLRDLVRRGLGIPLTVFYVAEKAFRSGVASRGEHG